MASAGRSRCDTNLLLPSYSDDAFGRTMRVERLSDGATVAAVLDRGPRKQTSCALGISTGQTWVLPNRPGHHFSRVLAMTPTELVLGERVVATIVSPVLDHIVRIELAALPALVAEWSK